MKKYYYLNGPEKNGPFSEDELVNHNLSLNTLIWTEGFENWKPLREIPELLQSVPPPPPNEIIVNSTNAVKIKKIAYLILIAFILFTASFLTVTVILEKAKKEQRTEIESHVERIFNGKFVVCDAVISKVSGEFQKNEGVNKLLFMFPKDSLDSLVNEKFWCKSGGFTFKKIRKVDDGYAIESIISTSMEYKKNAFSIRPSAQEPYEKAYKYFKNENSECLSPGSYDLIVNFAQISNDFYSIKNVYKPSEPFAPGWHSEEEGHFNFDYQILYFRTEGFYYEIRPNEDQIKNYTRNLSLKCFGISLILFLFSVLFFTNPFKWYSGKGK